MTTLHAGGKFSGKAYATSGGLHGVGASVVNALSSELTVEIARDKILYQQQFSRGKPLGPQRKLAPHPTDAVHQSALPPMTKFLVVERKISASHIVQDGPIKGLSICWC